MYWIYFMDWGSLLMGVFLILGDLGGMWLMRYCTISHVEGCRQKICPLSPQEVETSVMQQFVQQFDALTCTCCFISGKPLGCPSQKEVSVDEQPTYRFVTGTQNGGLKRNLLQSRGLGLQMLISVDLQRLRWCRYGFDMFRYVSICFDIHCHYYPLAI